MGAGDVSGPQRGGQASQGVPEKCGEQQLRHEHADDEQRLRHRDVVERGLSLNRQLLSRAPRPT